MPELTPIAALERVADRVGRSLDALGKTVTAADRLEREATRDERELRARVMEEVHRVDYRQ
ncbi:MAG: hypothetical protein AAF735_08470 [Myxococcota bacterium]